jgi:CelD/BcsL family acetyltransferase involved in cellulose biosynthesis
MKITVLPASRLAPEHLVAWDAFQRADAALDSPFFRPEFMRAVAAVRDDVEVAVMEEGGEPAAFFPFQRGRWQIARPVGGPMSDFHGVVARPGLAWDAGELVRGCGLTAWDFNHLPAAQEPFAAYQLAASESPYMDLSGGFEGYQAGRRRAGSQKVTQTLRKARKLEREVGPLRFEAHTTDPRAFAALLEWKVAQYHDTAATNVFSFPWTVRLLEHILGTSREAFAGMLSALYVGDRPAAVHCGMRCGSILHYWFPAYDTELSKYSPGLVLLIEMARAADALGVRRIDLGRGASEYKSSLMSGAIPLAEGTVAVSSPVRALRVGWQRTRAWVKSSALAAPARVVGRLTRPLRGWLALR